jgi:hypothetical protein
MNRGMKRNLTGASASRPADAGTEYSVSVPQSAPYQDSRGLAVDSA